MNRVRNTPIQSHGTPPCGTNKINYYSVQYYYCYFLVMIIRIDIMD